MYLDIDTDIISLLREHLKNKYDEIHLFNKKNCTKN